MERRVCVALIAALMAAAASCYSSVEAISKGSFDDNFSIMWSEDHFITSKDGQIWYLALDKDKGCGFQTNSDSAYLKPFSASHLVVNPSTLYTSINKAPTNAIKALITLARLRISLDGPI